MSIVKGSGDASPLREQHILRETGKNRENEETSSRVYGKSACFIALLLHGAGIHKSGSKSGTKFRYRD
jgi:hypothetical protein